MGTRPGGTTDVRDAAGSAPAEFVMVGALLALLTVAVLQFALVLHVRNTLQDAAAEGARLASLTGSTPDDGVARTRDLIATAIGDGYARNVRYRPGREAGRPVATIIVSAPLPVIGLLGVGDRLEVRSHAALETGLGAPGR